MFTPRSYSVRFWNIELIALVDGKDKGGRINSLFIHYRAVANIGYYLFRMSAIPLMPPFVNKSSLWLSSHSTIYWESLGDGHYKQQSSNACSSVCRRRTGFRHPVL